MCVWGTENMLFYDGDVDRLRPLAEAEDEEGSTVRRAWLEESTLVFEGDYSCPEVDKPHLVDLVLGLYGFILRVRGAGPTQTSGTQQTMAADPSRVRWRLATSTLTRQQTTNRISKDRSFRKTRDLRQQLASSRLHPVIIKNFQRCFPPEYFGDLPELFAKDAEHRRGTEEHCLPQAESTRRDEASAATRALVRHLSADPGAAHSQWSGSRVKETGFSSVRPIIASGPFYFARTATGAARGVGRSV